MVTCLSRLKLFAVTLSLGGAFCISTAQNRPDPPKPRPPQPAKWEPKPQQVFVPYWTLEPGWNTTLEIRNNVAQREISVQPVLRTAAGVEVPLPVVSVSSDHVVSINLREAAAAALGLINQLGSFGTVVYRFDGLDASNIFASAVVQAIGAPISFHFDSGGGDETDVQRFEGVWWLPQQTSTGYLIIANASSSPVQIRANFTDPSGKAHTTTVGIGPRQATRLNVRDIVSSAGFESQWGGVSLMVLSAATAISAAQVVFDQTTGFSALLKMFDQVASDQPRLRTLRAPMMALSTPDPGLALPEGTELRPQIFLRNTTSSPLPAAVRLNWRSANAAGTFAYPGTTLAPGEARLLDIAALQAKGEIPAAANWGTLAIQYQGNTADLVAVAASFDASGRYGLQTPFSWALGGHWKGSMWHVDAMHNSFITAGNGGDEPMNARMTLFYNGGKGTYHIEKRLAPGEQIWADVGRIIREQIPDRDGHTILPTVTSGSSELWDLDHPGLGHVFEGKLVLDKTYGRAFYGCNICCRQYGAALHVTPFSGPVGGGDYDTVTYRECDGTEYDGTGMAYGWFSYDTSIATLPDRYLSLVGVGSTTTQADIDLIDSRCRTFTSHPQQSTLVHTPIQHNYPRNPLTLACRISSFFDSVRNGKKHKALDVGHDDGNGGWAPPPYGTPVYAMEEGDVVAAVGTNGPASQPYPNCLGAPGNVKIKGLDNYYTIYFHITPTVLQGQHVFQGNQIGITDNSGCQRRPHLHVQRKDPSGTPVNITIPCLNPTPTTRFDDGDADDDVPDIP